MQTMRNFLKNISMKIIEGALVLVRNSKVVKIPTFSWYYLGLGLRL